jgi:CRP-like cAMP-binding protein
LATFTKLTVALRLIPGEYLFKALEVAMEMYFVTSGTCEAYDIDEKRIVSRFKAGDHFGDIALFPEVCQKSPILHIKEPCLTLKETH